MFFTKRNGRRGKVLEKCAKMRAAKERRRMERAAGTEAAVVGTVTFSGPVFHGEHSVRLLAWHDRPVVDLEVDGRVTCARTPRGARRAVLERIARCVR